MPARHSVVVNTSPYNYIFVKIGQKTPDMPVLASLPPFVTQCLAGKVGGMETPNQLSREAIEEFKAIYQEEFGETLSDDEVQEIAMRLLRFFGILNKDQ
jgi:hypothetical protein